MEYPELIDIWIYFLSKIEEITGLFRSICTQFGEFSPKKKTKKRQENNKLIKWSTDSKCDWII